MQAIVRRRLPHTLFSAASSSTRLLTLKSANPFTESPHTTLPRGTLSALWSAVQHRGAKVLGSDVRLGNIIQRKGRIYQVLKAQHTQHGRGGATIQVELRDVDSGNKIAERFRTDEAIERVFVEDKSFTYLYTEGDSIVIMEPDTFEQMEVRKDLFGKAVAYLKDNMKVTLQTYDGKPMSASVPQRVTCTVAEAQTTSKGLTATPQYKRVLLDNGLTVLAPSFIKTGDMIVINTTDDSYITSNLLMDNDTSLSIAWKGESSPF
ncbi:uncharacterized protein LOC131222638 isoform X2 [Magnolia sinica]|uniref:uncharacterized protein LOC131222638 isoform X2 n=1 Tax=Magnolia sinica TaxID=86752 RepID=UPI0026596FB4|nr:uncharacterized protein LOC131222638 isoform X2 [Magnolia sinica]